jgi:hypothetical protein
LLRLFKGSSAKVLCRGDIVAAIRRIGPSLDWEGAEFHWLLKVVIMLGRAHFDIFNIAENNMEIVEEEFMNVLNGHSVVNVFVDFPSHSTLIRIADSQIYK